MPEPITVTTDSDAELNPGTPGEGGAPPESKGTLKAMHEKFKAGMAELYDKDGTRKAKTSEDEGAEPAKEEKAPAQKQEQKAPEAAKAKLEPAAKADEIPASIKSPKAADEFRNLKMKLTSEKEIIAAELQKAKEDLAKATTERDALKKTPMAKPEELAKVTQERDELAARIEQIALEHSPAFQARFGQMFEEAKAQAISAAGEKNKEMVLQILELPPSESRKKQLAAVMEEMDQPDAMMLSVAVTSMDRARNERNRALLNHRDTIRQQQEMGLQQAQAEQAALMHRRAFMKDRVIEIARAQYDAFKSDGSIEADTRVKDYEADVEKAITGKLNESEAAMLPVMAVQGAYMAEHVVPKLTARVTELEQELAKVAGSLPKVENREESSNRPAQQHGSSFIAKYRQAMQE